MEKNLRNKNAIVTGANGGLGKAIVQRLAMEGCNIWACTRKEDDKFQIYLQETAQSYNVNIQNIQIDLANSQSIKKGFQKIYKEKRNIDILVNNAGIGHAAAFSLTSTKTMHDIFEVNTFAPMILSQYALKRMIVQKSGSIINIASTAGMDSNAGNCIYGPSKAALISFSKSLAAEMAPLGIRVNAIAPGASKTKMVKIFENIAKDHLLHRSAMERLADPEEIASVVAFLVSDDASFINGQVIRVDGGEQ